MYILLALGLGLILFIKSCWHSASLDYNERESDRIIAKHSAERDEFVAKYGVSKDSPYPNKRTPEQEIDYLCGSQKNEIMREVKKRIQEEAGFTPWPWQLTVAVLAHYGRIPEQIATWGVKTASNTQADPRGAMNERSFMIWLDKELRAHGIREPMYFVKEDDVGSVSFNDSMKKARLVGEAFPPGAQGYYFWIPAQPFQFGSKLMLDSLRW